MTREERLQDGIGLALSGGGFRATLFHLGSLWRINELGLLKKINRICSVSGGSITAGILGHRWIRLTFDDNGVAVNFVKEIAEPLRSFCSLDIDVSAITAGVLSIVRSVSDMVIDKYRKYLFGDATLQDLPCDEKGPRFIIYATNLQTGASVRFSKPYMADYRIGELTTPYVPLAVAVAASSAFPPFLSPVILRTDVNKWKETEGADLFGDQEFRSALHLTDGGVYDNLGLEAVWNRYRTILVSDAGAPLKPEPDPSSWWHNQLLRALGIITEQTRALRKRRLVEEFTQGERAGTYWGIKTHINDYKLPDSMISDNGLTGSLHQIRTRLNRFSEEEQGHLINWGYALTDTALRRHVLGEGTPKGNWPIPEYPLA